MRLGKRFDEVPEKVQRGLRRGSERFIFSTYAMGDTSKDLMRFQKRFNSFFTTCKVIAGSSIFEKQSLQLTKVLAFSFFTTFKFQLIPRRGSKRFH